ncbi:hypothetical protein [Caballeronia calidae]|uniref:hypothetical protein n=1 Tax=Caballeronia calidae TaxID=1777139 RepID=UPI0018DF6AC1|nr:hypothetical protein [Caballeronia calidae]
MTTSIVNVDGFLALSRGLTVAGEFNPQVAMVVFTIVATIFAFRARAPIWLLGVIGFALVLMMVLAGIADNEPQKMFRDFIYLTLLALSFLIFRQDLKGQKIDGTTFAMYLALFSLLVFPVLGVAGGLEGYDGRFPGFSTSPPIFANSVLLAYLIVRNARVGDLWTALFCALSVGCIVLSGTRSPLATLAVYEMLLLVSGQTVSRGRTAYFVILALGAAALALVAADIYDSSGSGDASTSRIFAQKGADGGSLETRSGWYLTILLGLRNNFFLGGFGAGAAERLTGYITHFDLLRYWYDYSIFFLLLFVYLIYKAHRCSDAPSDMHTRWYSLLIGPFVILNSTLLSMHNMFQVPGMILLFAAYLNCSTMRHRGACEAK